MDARTAAVSPYFKMFVIVGLLHIFKQHSRS